MNKAFQQIFQSRLPLFLGRRLLLSLSFVCITFLISFTEVRCEDQNASPEKVTQALYAWHLSSETNKDLSPKRESFSEDLYREYELTMKMVDVSSALVVGVDPLGVGQMGFTDFRLGTKRVLSPGIVSVQVFLENSRSRTWAKEPLEVILIKGSDSRWVVWNICYRHLEQDGSRSTMRSWMEGFRAYLKAERVPSSAAPQEWTE